jgi:hypothetical protein
VRTKKKRISRLEVDSQGLCDRLGYAETTIRELERKVAELEEKLSRATLIDWSKSRVMEFPDNLIGLGYYSHPFTVEQPNTCPLCHTQYLGSHVCHTVNPAVNPITFQHHILSVPKII